MIYKNVKLGTENDHELSIWIESDQSFDEVFIERLHALEVDGNKVGYFDLYTEDYGHYRSDEKFTFDNNGADWLKKIIYVIDEIKGDSVKIGVAIYSNEFTHIKGNLDEVTYDKFINEVKQ